MIVTRTPLRVSFFGGGTDLPEYFNQRTGRCLSAAINVYMHIVINETPHKRVKACYDDIEIAETASDIKHNRIRESLLEYSVLNNIEVSSFCHIPTKGTGLGSSSSFTVGLCTALAKRNGITPSPKELAESAYYIERVRCKESLGKQDQYAAAYGGLNLFTFNNRETKVERVDIKPLVQQQLENNLLFFYTGIKRNANDILLEQAKQTSSGANVHHLQELANCADVGAGYLKNNEIDRFGSLLHYAWELKRQLQKNVSNFIIDDYYSKALKAGALGGKLLGAGGGGYLMFYVKPDKQEQVRKVLNLPEYKFKFSETGTEVVYENSTAY